MGVHLEPPSELFISGLLVPLLLSQRNASPLANPVPKSGGRWNELSPRSILRRAVIGSSGVFFNRGVLGLASCVTSDDDDRRRRLTKEADGARSSQA